MGYDFAVIPYLITHSLSGILIRQYSSELHIENLGKVLVLASDCMEANIIFANFYYAIRSGNGNPSRLSEAYLAYTEIKGQPSGSK